MGSFEFRLAVYRIISFVKYRIGFLHIEKKAVILRHLDVNRHQPRQVLWSSWWGVSRRYLGGLSFLH